MLNILYEDNHIIVVEKPVNMPVQADETGDMDLLTLVKAYIKQKYNKPGEVYCGLVHRLDRPVGGIMVFARTSKAAARLSSQFAGGTAKKSYVAVVCGDAPSYARLENELLKDETTRTSTVVPKGTAGAKTASLEVWRVAKKRSLSLMDVSLLTGRRHQIRVQLSYQGYPIWGDQRYNRLAKPGQQIALYAYRLAFSHPVKKEPTAFTNIPKGGIWNEFSDALNVLKYGLRTAYIDENIVVVNKAAGISCASADGGSDTVEERLVNALGEAYPVHRIDVATSGLVIFARSMAAKNELDMAIRNQLITKKYRCIVKGRPNSESERLTLYAQKNANEAIVRVYDKKTPHSAEMITDYRVIERRSGTSLVEATLITGRTHQLRATFAHIGCPILGDDKYGDYDFNKSPEYRSINRGELCLCAVELMFGLDGNSPLAYLNNINISVSPSF